jgi:gamma-glutamyltranspeptidase/glutathione hydrolase
VALSERFGKLPFERLCEPAIRHARAGYAVAPIMAAAWQRAESRYQSMPQFGELFFPHGRAPKAGEIFSSNELAATLSEIAATKGESFYRGRLAEIIAATSRAGTGQMTIDDLAAHHCDWVEPINIRYHDINVHEIPPNGQGLAALIALGLLERFDLPSFPINSADSVHLQVECMKLGLADIARHLADPNWMTVSVEQLLAPERLDQLAARIDMAQAGYPADQPLREHGTVYLTTADQCGMMVSFIQSNFMGFGSGVVIPGTGISMQNRGHGFSLIKGHPNQVDGGKRPYHTIIPGFVTRDERPLMSFGVMGGHMQAQGHVQMITRIFDYRLDPQAASDYPRWYLTENYDLAVEPGFSPELLAELSQRGHRVRTDLDRSQFGGAQLIYKGEGGYCAGSDHRKDGLALPL